MGYDLVVRGGRVVDGTGMPGFSADVAVQDGRIARIGRIDESGTREIDAAGCVVAPGFIDVHTHYDVQLDWDPLASPSCWHGVTSVLTGNCGFTLAPAKPEDVSWLAAMLSRVEGMSKQALAEGFQFAGGSFGEFWGRLEGRLGVNAGGYVGHSAVRRWVLGDDASERTATDDEIEQMKELVRAAMREGAIGFSTSQIDIHVGDDGREVPSNHATPEEILALASVLSEFDHGAIEIIPRSFAEGYDEKDRALLLGLYRVSGKPVELNILTPTPQHPMGWQNMLEFCNEAFAQGARLHPQFTTNRLELHLKIADTFVFDEMPVWREILTTAEPERSRRLADPDWRSRMQAEWDDDDARAVAFDLGDLEIEHVRDEANRGLVGRSVGEVAEERGTEKLATFLDLALLEDLQMSFRTRSPEIAKEFIGHIVESGLKDPIVMAGSSDGGAHLASFTGADYSTRLLTEWVPKTLSLEQAIWRLTGMPATVHGLRDRGFLRTGAWADIVVYDPARLACGEAHLVRDFPAETERYVVKAEGYVATVVNGEIVMQEGEPTGALPGHFIRGA
ncbi:MAG: amidohydrolase family protein [Candidatus Binatia bacterium]|nr:amidohydrolase family protein [Candidatus Binatia bacterium]